MIIGESVLWALAPRMFLLELTLPLFPESILPTNSVDVPGWCFVILLLTPIYDECCFISWSMITALVVNQSKVLEEVKNSQDRSWIAISPFTRSFFNSCLLVENFLLEARDRRRVAIHIPPVSLSTTALDASLSLKYDPYLYPTPVYMMVPSIFRLFISISIIWVHSNAKLTPLDLHTSLVVFTLS